MSATFFPNFVKKCYFFAKLQDKFKGGVFLQQSVRVYTHTHIYTVYIYIVVIYCM